MTEIKICGLFRDCDIDYVNEARPGYAGFILQFPKSHRNISIPRAVELRKRLLPGIKAVGVFVNRPAEEILRAKETIGLDVIQLHGEETAEEIREIRKKPDARSGRPSGCGRKKTWKRQQKALPTGFSWTADTAKESPLTGLM